MKKGRPKKVRYVQKMPRISQFSPRGKPGRPDEVHITVDQYEAIKLADYEGYSQVDGASYLGVSRASFGRILREARSILADGLVNGKTIKISIGDVQVGVRPKERIESHKMRLKVKEEFKKYRKQAKGSHTNKSSLTK